MANKILFIAATHGNEGFSVEVFKKLEKDLPPKKYNYDWIIGNEKAYPKNLRFIDTDMNRAAPGNLKSSKYEEKRAAEITKLSKKYDFVIDVHGTNSDLDIVTIIPYPTLTNIILANLIPVNNHVIWYAEESKKKGPLAQYTGCPAIELECGPKNDKKTQDILYNVLSEFIININSQMNQNLIANVNKNNFFYVYGKLEGGNIKSLKDLKKIKLNNEEFYPFMSKSEYKGISCYKLKKVDLLPYFIY